jgi:hypothetical protein
VLDDLIAAGVDYSSVRDDIAPGDLLLLHHEFVANWYGVQIEAVQRFTGPFAHIAQFDRVVVGGEERVVVYESVVPHVRAVLVSATAEEGFFWISLNRPMSKRERDGWWRELGAHPYVYDKLGAIAAGAGVLPKGEDDDPRRWCAKAVALRRRESDVDLGRRYVPTDMAVEAQNRFNGRLRYVRMQ